MRKRVRNLRALRGAIAAAMLLAARLVASGASSVPNILFIAIDDLNDWVGCLGGHPQVQTPHIDALAAQGVLFTNAHCPAPVCGPSRAAIMSGLYPASTGIYSNNASYRERLPGVESMPAYLRRHGYHTAGVGKLFHGDSYSEGTFTEYADPPRHPWPREALLNKSQNPVFRWEVNGKVIEFPRNGMKADRPWQAAHTFDWGPIDVPEDQFRDAKIAQWGADRITRGFDRPFFLGVGFHLPHQPLFAPKRFHDMYPPDEVILPPSLEGDLDDLSRSGRDYALIPTTSGRHASVVAHGQWRNAVSSYLATASFVDHLVGKVIRALEASPYRDNTWILLWSDHGWHLGEKEHWGKATGWYRASRVPFIIVPPRSQRGAFAVGRRVGAPVTLIDMYPTIVDFCGLPAVDRLEGRGLLPLLHDPDTPWPDFTVTTFGRGNHAVTGVRWRYIHYFDGAEELYDLRSDPHEWHNLADHPEQADRLREMRAHLPAEPQWKQFIRFGHFKAVVPADGSAMLLFDHSVENHLEERFSEADRYPEVVRHIERWLREHPTDAQSITIPESSR